MTDPLNQNKHDKFAQRLRQIDQPVSLDADQLTKSVVAGKKRRKIRKTILLATLPAVCLLIGLAGFFLPNFSTDQPVAVNSPKNPETKIVTESIAPVERPSSPSMSDSMLQQIVFDFKRAKLKELRVEIESLKQAQAIRDWELTREFVSRSEVAIAASQIKHAF